MPHVNRAHHFALPLLVFAGNVTLGGCKAADQPAAAASDAPAGIPGVTLAGARLVLPAVPGNPGAAYFALDNESKNTVAVVGVAIAGAGKTEIHTPDMKVVDRAEAEPRTTLTFEPGKLHVMVFDVHADLKPGSETELTVVFGDGDKVSVPAKVLGAGAAAMGAMSEAPKP
jgi:copper(I)-binding protein